MRKRMRSWWPAAVWMAVIFATSCTVISSKQWVRAVTTHGPVRVRADQFQPFWNSWWWVFVKGYHVFEYALLTLLLLRPLKGRLSAVAGIAIAFAAGDEYHQTFVPGRGGRWTDVAIDGIGIALVTAVARLVGQRLPLKSPRAPSSETSSSLL